MNKTFCYSDQTRLRSSLKRAACEMFEVLLKDKANWISLDKFEYIVVEESGENPESVCGWIFKVPIVLNGEQYLLCIPNFYTDAEQHKEALVSMKKDFESCFREDERIDFEDMCACYKLEWIFGNKKIPQSSGNNLI